MKVPTLDEICESVKDSEEVKTLARNWNLSNDEMYCLMQLYIQDYKLVRSREYEIMRGIVADEMVSDCNVGQYAVHGGMPNSKEL